MKLSFLTISFALFFGVGAANAEDNYYYQQQGQVLAGNVYTYDNSYQIPSGYQGEHYPNESEGTVSYYGTNRTTQNTETTTDYYNYYYQKLVIIFTN